MNKIIFLVVVLKLISYNLIKSQNVPQSPCPNYFGYSFDGNSWYGLIEVPSPDFGGTLKLMVEFSLRAQLPSQDVGSLDLALGKNIALQKVIRGEPTRFRVRFPVQRPLPRLTSIVYDSQPICYGPEERGPIVTKIQLEYTLFTVAHTRPVPIPNLNTSPQVANQNDHSYLANFPLGSNAFSYQNPQNHFPEDDSHVNVINYNGPDSPIQIDNGNTHYHTPQTQIPQVQYHQVQQQPTQTQSPQVQYHQVQQQQPSPIHTTAAPTRQTTNSFWSSLKDEDICGMPDRSFAVTPLIVGGEPIKRGTWPWLVGVYKSDVSTLAFQCGGNLVSRRLVVTAAHCIIIANRVLSANEIVTYLGQFNINPGLERQDGSEMKQSAIIAAHPDYMRGNPNSYDADIAVIVLKSNTNYNEYIRPICLWTWGANDVREIVGKSGAVVGWGRDGNGNIVSPEPQKIDIPIVSDVVCLRSNEAFRWVTSNRTFCAGARDGTGPCAGDSGGGLAIKRVDRWTLRGIVSVAALDPITNTCNLNEFVVFTDVAKFTDWILSFNNL